MCGAGERVLGLRLAPVDPDAKVVNGEGKIVDAPPCSQPHNIYLEGRGLPGLYYGDVARPVGELGEASYDQAKLADTRPGRPRLVSMSLEDLKAYRDRARSETDEIAVAELLSRRFPPESARRRLNLLFRRVRELQAAGRHPQTAARRDLA